MHIDITEKLKQGLSSKPVKKKMPSSVAPDMLQLEIELNDNEEFNISHISLSAVTKKSTNEVYLVY